MIFAKKKKLGGNYLHLCGLRGSHLMFSMGFSRVIKLACTIGVF